MTNTGAMPATLIGFFFAMRIAITLVCTRWLGLDPQVSTAIQILFGVFLLCLLCFHSVGASEFPLLTLLRQPPVRWAVIFLSFSLLSFLWTGAVSPLSSFAYWSALAVDVATMLLLLRSANFLARANALLCGYMYGACALALLAWIMPAEADLRLGDLDYFNTNQIGNLCAFAFFFALYIERSGEGRRTFVKILLLLTLLRSLSKTTLAAILVSLAVLFLRDESISRAKKMWTIVGVCLTCVLFLGLFEAYFTIYTTNGNQAETLTGRTAIWAFALDAALKKPWIGNGFDALWHVIPPLGPDRFEARHAENEVLQQFFAYGIAGLLMLAGLYGALFRQLRQIRELPRRLVLQSLLIYILVRGLAEAEPFDLLLPLWSIVLFSTLSADRLFISAPQKISMPEPPYKYFAENT